MSTANQNPFQTPGKSFQDIKRKKMPSGQIVEIRLTELISMETTMRKERVAEIYPGMADGTAPEELADIRECQVCLGLFQKGNVQRCPACGCDYCYLSSCSEQVKVSKDERIAVCVQCAASINTSPLERAIRKFWTI